MTMRSVFLVGAIALVIAGSVAAKENVDASGAEENVRAVQSKRSPIKGVILAKSTAPTAAISQHSAEPLSDS